MDSKYTELKTTLSTSTSTQLRSSTSNIPTLENERILETLCEILETMLEEIFSVFPEINENNIIKYYTEIGKFFTIHHTDFDSKAMKFFEEGCLKFAACFNWELYLKKCLYSQWRNLFLRNSVRAPESQNDFIDELVKDNKQSLNTVLALANEHIGLTQMTLNIFPALSEFDEFFLRISRKLNEKTYSIYSQIKDQKESGPLRIQKAQIEDLVKKKRNRTEWVSFSESLLENVSIEHYKCSIGNCCKRLISRPVLSKVVNCVYTGPVGWEITRVNTEVIDGRYTSIMILSTSISENCVYIEVEVKYHQFGSKEIWFNLKIEGSSVKKKVYETKTSEIKEFLVIIDQNGSHEIPEEI